MNGTTSSPVRLGIGISQKQRSNVHDEVAFDQLNAVVRLQNGRKESYFWLLFRLGTGYGLQTVLQFRFDMLTAQSIEQSQEALENVLGSFGSFRQLRTSARTCGAFMLAMVVLTVVMRVIAVRQSFNRAAGKSGEKRDSST